METTKFNWSRSIWKRAKITFWMLAAYIVLSHLLSPTLRESARANLLEQFQEKRKSRAIAMIHRQDSLSLFGVPVSSSISIEDSEAILRVIRLTPPTSPSTSFSALLEAFCWLPSRYPRRSPNTKAK